MERVSELQIREAVANFNFVGRLKSRRPFGSGHINDTYLLVFEIGDMGDVNVILQRMNREIFTKPVELMENIVGVTSYLREKIIENGGDPERETLNMIPAKDGKAYYVDSKGEYWRAYKFITDATSYDQVEKPEDFYESAVAFGHFQRLLADYPAETLHETIEGFHDTKARFQVFKEAVAKVIEYASKIADNQAKLSTRFNDLAQIIGEAATWARMGHSKVVTAEYVTKALKERIETNMVRKIGRKKTFAILHYYRKIKDIVRKTAKVILFPVVIYRNRKRKQALIDDKYLARIEGSFF